MAFGPGFHFLNVIDDAVEIPVGIVVDGQGHYGRLIEQAVHGESRVVSQKAEFKAEEIGNPFFTFEALEEERVFPEIRIDANMPASLS